MKSNFRTTLIGTFIIFLSACASTPKPKPEDVCTADWIGKRSYAAATQIKKRTKPALESLAIAAKNWAQGKTPNPLQMMSLSSSVKDLTKELETGQGMQDLKNLARTCNDPKIITSALTKMMQESGLSTRMISFVESLSKYQELITTAMERRDYLTQ
ncbi:MAG: hypothetical protein ACPGVT_08730 [Maricaulaceae bacterium]